MRDLTCQLEITRLCDHRCSYCYDRNPLFALDDRKLTANEWIDIAASIEVGVFQSCIITGGDPFCRLPLLFSILKNLPTDLNHVHIFTSGSAMTTALARDLKRLRQDLALQISLDAVTKQSHERSRKLSGAWEKVIQCCVILNREGIKYNISSVVSSLNLPAVPSIARIAYALGASHVHFAEEMSWDPLSGLFTSSLSNEEWKVLEQEIESIRSQWSGLLDIYLNPSYDKYLDIVRTGDWGGIIVREDGSYLVDCLIPISHTPGYPEIYPGVAIQGAFSNKLLNQTIEEYAIRAKRTFTRRSGDAPKVFYNENYGEIVSYLISLGVDCWKIKNNTSNLERNNQSELCANSQMKIIMESAAFGKNVGALAQELCTQYKINYDVAFIDSLIGIQQLIDSDFFCWDR